MKTVTVTIKALKPLDKTSLNIQFLTILTKGFSFFSEKLSLKFTAEI